MADKEILSQIDALVAEEHELRKKSTLGHELGDEDRDRLKSVEAHLDQCWDLLRQRRAAVDYGSDPESAASRPIAEVEGYLG